MAYTRHLFLERNQLGELGKVIERARDRAGLSQREAARRAGLSLGPYQYLEQGVRAASVSLTESILSVLPFTDDEAALLRAAARPDVGRDRPPSKRKGTASPPLTAPAEEERRATVLNRPPPPAAPPSAPRTIAPAQPDELAATAVAPEVPPLAPLPLPQKTYRCPTCLTCWSDKPGVKQCPLGHQL